MPSQPDSAKSFQRSQAWQTGSQPRTSGRDQLADTIVPFETGTQAGFPSTAGPSATTPASGNIGRESVESASENRDTCDSSRSQDIRRKTTLTSQPDKKASSKRVQQLGDFELKKKLGKGGMGEVFLARQVSLDRLVALKTLSRDLAKREDFVKRFQREARSMAKLDHPNIVKVYAVDSYKGIHFAAIEYIDGSSVQNWLDKLGPFSIADAVHIALVCAEALRNAHDLTLVHRDIKPDNILV
ncbi:MAG: serine/threonine protein kinase, partial [Planctomycetaceae bacterium]|nr:serine/threonine protein kinase [Planctomycetaceae bacterium]